MNLKQIAEIPRSPWFPGDVKPVRKGVYQTLPAGFANAWPVYQHWDGECWGAFDGDVARAARFAGIRSNSQSHAWRGLARDPYAEGKRRKDEGIKQALENESEHWQVAALTKIREWAAKPENRKGEFAFEDIRAWVLETGLGQPHDHHVWGALARAAIAAGIIVPTGKYRAAVSPATHAHPVRLYRVAE